MARNVARELVAKYKTTILMATAEDPATLNGIGAAAVLPKPYDSNHVVPALKAVEALAAGQEPDVTPPQLKPLR